MGGNLRDPVQDGEDRKVCLENRVHLGAVEHGLGILAVGHLLLREGGTEDVLGQALPSMTVVTLDLDLIVNIESGVFPGEELEGLTPGPRIYPSENWISTSSGHGDIRGLNERSISVNGVSHFYDEYVTTVADGPDETTRAVRDAFRRGATQIKLFTSGGVTSTYDPLHSGPNAEEIRAAVAVAEAWDTYVLTHSFNEDAIRMAIDNGVKSIEHAPFLTDEIAQTMIEKGIYLAVGVAPVLEISVEQARAQYSAASFKKWLPVREAAEEAMKFISRNPELKVVLGSDLLGPWNNMKETDDKMNLEFRYFAEAIGNYRTLRMATSVAGEMNLMTGRMNPYTDGPLGVIEKGAYADILIIDGNPLNDIELMTDPERNFKVIMKDGVVHKNTL